MRWVFLFVIFSSVISCVNNDKVPAGIIPKDSMQNILWDMIQADQFSKQYILKDSAKINARLETMKLYQEVFQIHHITKDEFQKSYQFYISRPDLTKSIFDSLTASANRHRQEAFKQVAPKPKPILKGPLPDK
jgi:uncharacterized protein DUF4296